MRNEKVQRWFDDGLFVSAILGEDGFFIPDSTNRLGHDRILVVRQLLLWADTAQKRDLAANGINEAAYASFTKNDMKTIFDIVLCYSVVSRTDQKILPVAMSELFKMSGEILQRNRSLLSEDSDLKYFAENMANRFPEIRNMLKNDPA